MKPHWFHILLSLADGPRHGLAIRDEVLARTDGEVHLWPATLYRVLHRLEGTGLIREVAPPNEDEIAPGAPRFYALTPEGKEALQEEVGRLERYVAAARARDIDGA